MNRGARRRPWSNVDVVSILGCCSCLLVVVIVGVLLPDDDGGLALGRFVPHSDARRGFVVVVVLDVFGDVLKAFRPVDRMWWWWCWRIDPHSDETVGRVLLVVVSEEEISFGRGDRYNAWVLES